MKTVKNIIFDLGGILIHLDLAKTEAAFRALLGGGDYSEVAEGLRSSGIFEALEVNGISEEVFVGAIQESSLNSISREDVETAWNAMLLTFPVEGVNLIKKIKTAGYRLYILSNTNSIHIRAFRKILEREHGITDFDALFDKVYYSHLVELRKPNVEIFQYVLDDAGLDASETLFIDDTSLNLEGAAKVGLQTLLLEQNGDLEAAVDRYLEL
jgi:FMN phosphatase YigB (HAD superfamily)